VDECESVTNGNNVQQCSPPAACYTWDSVAGVLSGNCTDGYVDNIAGRDLHLSTVWLNLNRLCHCH